MNLESPKVNVAKSAEYLFNALSDVKNFEKLMPENIAKFEVIDENCFEFGLKGMPEIKLVKKEAIPNSKIVLGAASSKLPFTLTANLSEAVQKRPNAFTPSAVSSLVLAFASRKYEDDELTAFMISEAKKIINEAQCFDVILLLDGLNRWGCFDRELVDQSVERLVDTLDRFTSRDVTHLLVYFF